MAKTVGLARNFTLEWIDAAADCRIQGKNKDEAKEYLDTMISAKIASPEGSTIRALSFRADIYIKHWENRAEWRGSPLWRGRFSGANGRFTDSRDIFSRRLVPRAARKQKRPTAARFGNRRSIRRSASPDRAAKS